MTEMTDKHLKRAFSIACDATREGPLPVLDEVADNLELSDDGILQALRAALNYMLVPGSRREGWGAFHPSMEFGDKVYPPPLSRIPPSWMPIWARAFSCAPYAYIRARFADLLWEAKYGGEESYKWSRQAIDAYLQALDEPFGEHVYLVGGAIRALALAKQLNDKQRQSSAIAVLRTVVRKDIDNSEIMPGTTIRSLTVLADLSRAQCPKDLGDLIDAALQQEQSLHAQLACLELKVLLAQTHEEQQGLWEAQVNTHADEGRSKEGLARFMHFQNAIQLAEKHGLRDLANEMRQEAGPLGEESFERVEIAEEIPAHTMEAIIGYFVGDDSLPNALRRFGAETPSGDPAQNRARAQDRMNEFPVRFLMTNLITGDQGELIKQFQTPEESEEYQVVSIETENICFFAATAVHILKEIGERYGAVGTDAKVFESELVDKTQAEWIALAVRHYEAGDYRSSVSVMAPRLENTIRGLAQRVGIVTLRDSKGGKKVGGVKDLFGVLEELKDRMPEPSRRYWRTLLVESLGLNLRDRIAHGLIDDPTPQDAAILIHAACHLLLLRSQPQSDGQG